MINSLENLSMQVCCAAVFAAMFRIIFPKLKDYGVFSVARLVLVVYVAGMAASALRGFDAEELLPASGGFSVSYADDLYAEAVSDELAERIASELRGDGINVQDVRIEISVTQEGLTLNNIGLVFEDISQTENELSEALSAEWKVPVYVVQNKGDS